MTTPVLESSSGVTSGSSGTTTLATPASTVTDDGLLVFIALEESGDTTITKPSGDWELIKSYIDDEGSVNVQLAAYWLPPGISKSGNYSWTWSGANYTGGSIHRVSGSDLTVGTPTTRNDPGATETPDTSNTEAGLPAHTTAEDDTLLIGAYDSWTNQPPTSIGGSWSSAVTFNDSYGRVWSQSVASASTVVSEESDGNTDANYVGMVVPIYEGSVANAAPDAPTSVTATAGDDEAVVTWTDETTGVPNPTYTIERKTGAGSFGALTSGIAEGVETYTDTTAVNGTAYTYRVRATNSEGDSAWVETSEVTPAEPTADAGSLVRISGSGQGLPGTSAAVLDVGNETSDPDGIITESASGRYVPQIAGYYLITARGRFDSTHNNRLNITWQITKNGSTLSGTGGSSYARNTNNPYAYPQANAILYFNGTTDYFEIEHIRDTGTGSPAGSYNFTRAKVVLLATGNAGDTPYARYSTPADGAYTGTSPTAVSGWDVVTESDTAVIELQAGGTDIEVKEANRPYLIVYSLENDDSGGNRTQRLSDVTLAGNRVAHSVGYAYQRDSSNQRAYPNGIALVRPTSSNQDINVRAWGYSISTTWWGVFDNGSWSLGEAATRCGIMIIALPADTDVAIYEDGTGNQDVTGASDVTLNATRTTVTEDAPFSRQSNTDVDVTETTDVFAYAAALIERQTASANRATMGLRWVKEATEITESGFGSYLRGDQGSEDCPNMVISSIFCDAATSGDTFQVERYAPGSESGTNDFTWNGSGPAVGSFFIDLPSLAGSAAPTSPPPRNPIHRIRHLLVR